MYLNDCAVFPCLFVVCCQYAFITSVPSLFFWPVCLSFLAFSMFIILTFDTISFLAFAQLFALEHLLLQLEVMPPPASSPAFVLNFCRSILFQCLILLHVMCSRIQCVLQSPPPPRSRMQHSSMTLGLPAMRNHLQLPVLPPRHIFFLPANPCSFYTGLGVW